MTHTRAYLAGCIPKLFYVQAGTMSDAAAAAYINDPLLRRVFVAIDVLVGVFGGNIQDMTISDRTALRLLEAQRAGNLVNAPLWALSLGALLEKIDPGHLQQAILADYCRSVRLRIATSGA